MILSSYKKIAVNIRYKLPKLSNASILTPSGNLQFVLMKRSEDLVLASLRL